MRALIQRVNWARVETDGRTVGEIGRGLLAFVGVGLHDTGAGAVWLAEKVAHLRIFPDAGGKMNLSVLDIGGEVLVVSQFTLYGDAQKGRRPAFTDAMAPAPAAQLIDVCIASLRDRGLQVETGAFGAHMLVQLENDGPVTILIESPPAKPLAVDR